jgi:predicted ABC-type ATPase
MLLWASPAKVAASVDRVRRRVEAGGHGIPEETIRRRFDKSSAYLENIYKSIVDKWYIWGSREGSFTLAESREQT